jgi:hypothetical protein
METIVKKVDELIKNNEACPLPLSVIPNYMGINLCSVDEVSWDKQENGELTTLTIRFIPNDPEIEENGDLIESITEANMKTVSAFMDYCF